MRTAADVRKDEKANETSSQKQEKLINDSMRRSVDSLFANSGLIGRLGNVYETNKS